MVGTNVATLLGHKDRVWAAAWHPDGKLLATCSTDRSIRLWRKEGAEWTSCGVLDQAHLRTVRSVAWSPDGCYLASASFDATVNIWDRKSGGGGGCGDFECNATLEGHENEVKSVSWSKCGKFLATCSRDKSVWVWEVATDGGPGEDDEFECLSVLPSHSQDVKKVLFHPEEPLLASASYDNTIKIYREEPGGDDWMVSSTLAGHESTVWSIDFDAAGSRLASVSDDRTLKVWQRYLPGNAQGVATPEGEPAWKCVCTLSGYHERPIYDVAWCSVTGLLATACGDDCIRIFLENPAGTPDAPTFDLLLTLPQAHDEDVNGIAWNPKSPGLLASTSDDATVKLWDFSAML
ncbi:cytosolic iron-sulfur assembly component 1 [Oratosquilla oratoria]|uniref:cytosolic iron-sulfur assembly component 1 n=1 Tax=Oratosquilla oratoria TaxID=337810 RepID=UPI003F765847